MFKHIVSLAALAAVSLSFAACARPEVAPIEWNRPFKPWTGPAPKFERNLVIANPPHPAIRYANYEDEPTRFIFRPRNVIQEEVDDGTGGGEGDFGYDMGFDMGGGEE